MEAKFHTGLILYSLVGEGLDPPGYPKDNNATGNRYKSTNKIMQCCTLPGGASPSPTVISISFPGLPSSEKSAAHG